MLQFSLLFGPYKSMYFILYIYIFLSVAMWCDAPKFENDLFLYENLAAFWRIPLKSSTSHHVKDSARYVHIYISERNAVRRISPDMVTGTHGCVCSGYEHEDHDVSIAM